MPQQDLDKTLDALLSRPTPLRPEARKRLEGALQAAQQQDAADFWVDHLLADHPIAASPTLAARIQRATVSQPARQTPWWQWASLAALVIFGVGLGVQWTPTGDPSEGSAPGLVAVAVEGLPPARDLDDTMVFALLDGLGGNAQVLLSDPELRSLALARP